MCESHRGRARSNEDMNISSCGLLSPAPVYLARCDWPVVGFRIASFPALHVLSDSLRDMLSAIRVCLGSIVVAEGGR